MRERPEGCTLRWLPHCPWLWRRESGWPQPGRRIGMLLDQPEQQLAQRFAQPRQIHPLIAPPAAGADRAVALGQQRLE